jgi:hypothetical protein
MPTTSHGRDTLEKAWQRVISGDESHEQLEHSIALALISIALSLRKIAGSMSSPIHRH